MQRTLEPELLDSLPHDHPDALHNRRDLGRINALMGNHRWIARTLPPLLRNGETALEIGAGTGELGRRLRARGVAVAGLDLWPRPADWPADAEWHRADLRAFAAQSRHPAVVANLILHQFADEDLAQLGRHLQRHARVIVACEPQRRRIFQLLYRAVTPLLGANHVSRHDGHVSIAAGFRHDELPRTLQLDPAAWRIRCSETWLGGYRLLAVRKA